MVNSFGLLTLGLALAGVALAGCDRLGEGDQPEQVWGRRGLSDGRFQKPRAVAYDSGDRLYIVDMTARIQVFDPAGRFLRSWRTPESHNGRPTGLAIDRDGNLLVADTHYFRVLCYTPEGELLWTLGGTNGQGPGEFGFVTDVAQDAQGNYYVGEYGAYDRIQKFSPQREFLDAWGSHGAELGQFARPQSLVFDAAGRLWVADACNHRVQIFDPQGRLLDHWGAHGAGVGQLSYPYDLTFDAEGNVAICEYGNHRVQKFTPQGQSLAVWGRSGRGPGELYNPWGLIADRAGRLHVLDSNNHRVQTFRW